MSTPETPLSREQLTERLRSFMESHGAAYGLVEIGYFGSNARGEARAGSDVDIVYRMKPSAKPTLFDLAHLREELVECLARPVDLIEFREGMAHGLRERIRKEATYV